MNFNLKREFDLTNRNGGIYIDEDKLLQLIDKVKSTNNKKPILVGTDKTINTLRMTDWFHELEKYADVRIMPNSFKKSSIVEDNKVYVIPNTTPYI